MIKLNIYISYCIFVNYEMRSKKTSRTQKNRETERLLLDIEDQVFFIARFDNSYVTTLYFPSYIDFSVITAIP